MADDPRIEVAERHIWKGAQAAVTNSVRPHTIGSLRRAAREALAELDAADPLCALLADEDRALQLLRRAIADPAQFLPRAGYGTPDAETIPSWSARAVLAALREVAGL